jgi:hypothetical protein
MFGYGEFSLADVGLRGFAQDVMDYLGIPEHLFCRFARPGFLFHLRYYGHAEPEILLP